MACKIEGCLSPGSLMKSGNRVFTKGYCQKHYERLIRHGYANTVKCILGRDRGKHPLYTTYRQMVYRCLSPKSKNYTDYGGRGIGICNQWMGINGFEQFVKDMGDRPKNTTLDRIKNDGNYSKENCRWATHYQQAANKRNSNNVVGVCFLKSKNKYAAYLFFDKKNYHLGFFDVYEDAVKARRDAEQKYINKDFVLSIK